MIITEPIEVFEWCAKCHADVNHEYDGHPYAFHLAMVQDYVKKYSNYLPTELNIRRNVYNAAAGHDLTEDTRKTYNNVKEKLGIEVADIIFALTNEKGKTRKDRANAKYYSEMCLVHHAPFLKMCDRLANVKHSANVGSSMLKVYRKENDQFLYALAPYPLLYPDMTEELKTLLA